MCFARVIEAGSFAAAGRRLGMTTSGVSKAVGRLEAEHGVRLLHRSTHALSLTNEGEQLLEDCREVLRGYERVQTALATAADGGKAGRVRISAPPGFARKWLLPVLAQLLEAHPEITFDVRSSYALIDLADEGIDLALRTGASVGLPGLVSQRLLSSPWCVCASPAYLARRGTPSSPGDLVAHRLLGFRSDHSGRAGAWRFRSLVAEEEGNELRLDIDTSVVFDDGCAAYDMAAAGHGLVWAPEWLASEDLRLGRMVEVLAAWRSGEQVVSIVRRDRRHTPRRLHVVIDALLNAAGAWHGRDTSGGEA